MLNLLAGGNDACLLLHHRPTAHPPMARNRKARRTGLSETDRRLLSGFQLDHVTRNCGGIAVQDPGPEPLLLHLGIDQRIAALGLDSAVLRANKTIVLTNRDQTEQHQAGGACFTVANDGVLVAVVLLSFHRGAGASRQNQTTYCCGYNFAK